MATTLINNVYQMIHPTSLGDELANSDMSPALQIGRMDVPAEADDEWNNWYSTVYVPNYEKVDGCIRGRRWKSVRGEPSYATVYEFANPQVSSTPACLEQRDIHPDNVRMREVMTHAPPGRRASGAKPSRFSRPGRCGDAFTLTLTLSHQGRGDMESDE